MSSQSEFVTSPQGLGLWTILAVWTHLTPTQELQRVLIQIRKNQFERKVKHITDAG